MGSKWSGGGWEERVTLATAFSAVVPDEVQVCEQSVANTPDVGIFDEQLASDKPRSGFT